MAVDICAEKGNPMKFLALILALLAGPLAAETYKVAPAPGAVQALIATGKIIPGDIIALQDGDFGPLVLQTPAFAAKVTIRAQHKGKAHVDSILVTAGANLTIGGLNVWPANPYAHGANLIETAPGTSAIIFNGLDIRGGADAANFPAWDQAEWLKRRANGVWLAGPNSIVMNSQITAVSFGVTILGPDSKALGNVINGIGADGLRGQGARGVFRDNTVENFVSIDDNHGDGFQAFTDPAHPIAGLVIERNKILEWVLPPNPLQNQIQGIGLFDGFYDDLTIRNNLVVVTNGHGISLYGARRALIASNTVVPANGLPGKWPWITVNPHKNGTPSENVTVVNNVAEDFGQPDAAHGIVYSDNLRITDPRTFFEDLIAYVPKATSGALGTANPAYAVKMDVNRKKRGAPFDIGAVEGP